MTASPSFEPIHHIYHDGTKAVPSVTGIMRHCGLSGSYEFSGKIHAFRGSCVHEMSALVIAGAQAPYPMLNPLLPPYDGYEDYVKVHGEIPGYIDAVRKAKVALKLTGVIYECPMILVGSHGGTFDLCAWTDTDQIWEIKSGTWPALTVVQACAYEDLILRGRPINPDHPGLPWLLDLVKSGRKLKRCGLRLEKTGKFTAYYECPKGRSYNDPMWMNVWKSALFLYNNVPDHAYEEKDEYGRVFKRSHLSDLKWVAEQVKERLTGTTRDVAMRAADNLGTIRETYKLL